VATGERQNIKIFGTDYPTQDGTCVRDYVHVSDLAQAHLLALEALMAGKNSAIYNLGNNKGYSVREVIELPEKSRPPHFYRGISTARWRPRSADSQLR